MPKIIKWEKIDIFKDDDAVDLGSLGDIGLIDIIKLSHTNRFNMWLGHTNFRISSLDKSILDDEIEGIETLQIVSPLRFIVSIGMMFDEAQIKKQIETKLCGLQFCLPNDVLHEIQKLQIELAQFPDWRMYIMPNGIIEYTTKEDDNFLETIQIYEEAEKMYGGLVLTPIQTT